MDKPALVFADGHEEPVIRLSSSRRAPHVLRGRPSGGSDNAFGAGREESCHQNRGKCCQGISGAERRIE
eukprot:265513-Pyramimonas_sp.AAC.1